MKAIADIVANLDKSRVLVVGLARSGIAAARLLVQRGAAVMGTDRSNNPDGTDEIKAIGVDLRLGVEGKGLVENMDLVVLSPGVSLVSQIPAEAAEKDIPVLGELELAWRLAKVPTLAITGTNGKSTTTSLCAHLLQSAGKRVFVGGNIGKPMSRILLDTKSDEIGFDWAVVEVSSFQLEHLSGIDGFVPQVGICLNLTPDHLDRHGSMNAYQSIKRRMFEGMGRSCTGVFFKDDNRVYAATDGLGCSKKFFGRGQDKLENIDAVISRGRIRLGKDLISIHNPRLRGDHNAENTAAALLAVQAAGIQSAVVGSALESFAGLAHRMEPVRELDEVLWINDSKGTNPDATAKSLTGFDGKVVLIAGGRGKGTGFEILRGVITQKVEHLVLLGEQAERISMDLDGCAQIHMVHDMQEAIDVSRRLAKPGYVVMLSPACASFDMFRDYEQRGEVFAALVRSLGELK